MSIPEPIIEIAFNFGPTQVPSESDWTDISPRVREPIQGQRGRQQDLGRIETGRATLILSNGDGRFDPTNPSSPYFPRILPNRHIRIRALYNGVYYPVWRGFTAEWKPMFHGRSATVQLTCVDALGFFAKADATYVVPIAVPYRPNLGGLTLLSGVAFPYLSAPGTITVSCPDPATLGYSRPSGYTVRVCGRITSGMEYGNSGFQYNVVLNAANNWTASTTAWSRVDSITIYDSAVLTNPAPAFDFTLRCAWNTASGVQIAGSNPFGSVLDAIGWPTALRQLDALTASIQDYGAAVTVLDALQQIAESDGGILFAAADGTITYHNRNRRRLSQATIRGAIGYVAPALPYQQPELVYNEAQIVNNVVISRVGGAAPIQALDSASKDAYGKRTYSPTSDSLVTTDAEAAQVAVYLLNGKAQPRIAIESITLLAQTATDVPNYWHLSSVSESVLSISTYLAPAGATTPTSAWATVLGTDLSAAYNVTVFTPYNSGITQQSSVEAVAFTITKGDWTVSWSLAQLIPDSTGTWRLADTQTSVLDSTTRL